MLDSRRCSEWLEFATFPKRELSCVVGESSADLCTGIYPSATASILHSLEVSKCSNKLHLHKPQTYPYDHWH